MARFGRQRSRRRTGKSAKAKSSWAAQRRHALQVLGRKRLPKKQLPPSLRETMGIQHPDRFQRKGRPQMKPITEKRIEPVTETRPSGLREFIPGVGYKEVQETVVVNKPVESVVGHKIKSWPVKKLSGRSIKSGSTRARGGRRGPRLGAGPQKGGPRQKSTGRRRARKGQRGGREKKKQQKKKQ